MAAIRYCKSPAISAACFLLVLSPRRKALFQSIFLSGRHTDQLLQAVLSRSRTPDRVVLNLLPRSSKDFICSIFFIRIEVDDVDSTVGGPRFSAEELASSRSGQIQV